MFCIQIHIQTINPIAITPKLVLFVKDLVIPLQIVGNFKLSFLMLLDIRPLVHLIIKVLVKVVKVKVREKARVKVRKERKAINKIK